MAMRDMQTLLVLGLLPVRKRGTYVPRRRGRRRGRQKVKPPTTKEGLEEVKHNVLHSSI